MTLQIVNHYSEPQQQHMKSDKQTSSLQPDPFDHRWARGFKKRHLLADVCDCVCLQDKQEGEDRPFPHVDLPNQPAVSAPPVNCHWLE